MTAAPSSTPGCPRATPRTVVIAGNPNSGKSTLFNALTGMRQKVGNYPGVTVEKKIGRFFGTHGEPFDIVDLPGTYSLQSRSPDEAVSRDVLLGRQADVAPPDVLLCVVDATNLERNLYLVAQLAELGLPLVVALNMADMAERQGLRQDPALLGRLLGCPVVPTVASARKGLVELRQALTRQVNSRGPARAPLPPALEQAAHSLAQRISLELGLPEEAAFAEAILLISSTGEPPAPLSTKARDELLAHRAAIESAGHDPVSAAIDARYAWVQGICAQVQSGSGERERLSDHIDSWLTHRVWGWVFFLGVMGLMFFTIFRLAEVPMGWIESGQQWLAAWVRGALPPAQFRDLLTDGVLSGVGGVVIFLPQILLLFLFLGLLEDTGYLARAAFIIDRVMSRVGLHGKSFVPLLSSFACAIPGIMAARTIDSTRDRLVTILVAPLMSCSARLPVYTVLIAALLPLGASPWLQAGILLALYLLGMAAAFATAWLLRRTLFRGEGSTLLLEMPPYRRPSLRVTLQRMLERSGLFLRRAGTVILAISILIWALSTYPRPDAPDASPTEVLEHSIAGRLGRAIEPALAPLGFDWKIGIGIVSSLAAREVFVSTMAVIYQVEEGDAESEALRAALLAERHPDGRPVYTPLVCIGLMVFYVLAMQCVSTLAVVRRETNSWRWPALQFAYMSALAWGGAWLVYQGGRWLGWS